MLKRLAVLRAFMRQKEINRRIDEQLPASVGMAVADVEALYRLLAIAKYEDRYVVPPAHTELAGRLLEQQGGCGLDFAGGPGNCGAVPPPRHAGRRADNGKFMLQMAPPGAAGARAPDAENRSS